MVYTPRLRNLQASHFQESKWNSLSTRGTPSKTARRIYIVRDRARHNEPTTLINQSAEDQSRGTIDQRFYLHDHNDLCTSLTLVIILFYSFYLTKLPLEEAVELTFLFLYRLLELSLP